MAILKNSTHTASRYLIKSLSSSIANGVHNDKLSKDNLYISTLLINQGMQYKRFKARARGRADQIKKQTSHIILGVSEKTGELNG